MQSTGQTVTHPVSTQSMQRRVMVQGIVRLLLRNGFQPSIAIQTSTTPVAEMRFDSSANASKIGTTPRKGDWFCWSAASVSQLDRSSTVAEKRDPNFRTGRVRLCTDRKESFFRANRRVKLETLWWSVLSIAEQPRPLNEFRISAF